MFDHSPTDAEVRQAMGFAPDDDSVTIIRHGARVTGDGNKLPPAMDIDELLRDMMLNRDEVDGRTPLEVILDEVYNEVERAQEKHPPMHSAHEGHSVIREELDELWDEVKADRGYAASARKEAIQIACTAVRYVLDLHLSHPPTTAEYQK